MPNLIAVSDTWAVEYDCRMLIIHRRADDHHIALKGHGVKTAFLSSSASHGVDRATECFVKMTGPGVKWQGAMYKAGVLAKACEVFREGQKSDDIGRREYVEERGK